MINDAYIISVILKIISVFILLAVHQFSVAYVSSNLGDPTAKTYRRIKLNPFSHYDPLGALLMIVSSIGIGVTFGWAEPIPYSAGYFRNNKRNTMLVGLAGPISNMVLAVIAILSMKILGSTSIFLLFNNDVLMMFLKLFATINISFAIFSLIPVSPLDGSRIFASIMPPKWQYYLTQHQGQSLAIVLVLAFMGLLTPILSIGTNIVIFTLDKTISLLLGQGL